MQRGEAGWKFKPIQSAPAAAQASVSFVHLTPHTSTWTRSPRAPAGDVSEPVTPSGDPQLRQGRFELRLGVDADQAIDFLAFLEDQDGRDGRDPQATGCLLILVGVH